MKRRKGRKKPSLRRRPGKKEGRRGLSALYSLISPPT